MSFLSIRRDFAHNDYRLSHPSLIRNANQAGRARAKNTSLSLDLLFSQRLCRLADGLVMVYFFRVLIRMWRVGGPHFAYFSRTIQRLRVLKNNKIKANKTLFFNSY